MVTITLQVDAPPGQVPGIKEVLSMELEKFGNVRVIAVDEGKPEQMQLPLT